MLSGALASDAIFELRSGLLTSGEERFPYLEFDFPGRETRGEDRNGTSTQ